MDAGTICRHGRPGGAGLRGDGGVLNDLNAIDWGFAVYWAFAVVAFVAACGALFIVNQLFSEWRSNNED